MGSWKHSEGYRFISYGGGRQILEHRYQAELALGRPLRGTEEVHHANGKRNGGTLVICPDRAYHMLLHQRMRALAACGNADWRKCYYCKKYDVPTNLYRNKWHQKCNNAYRKSKGASGV